MKGKWFNSNIFFLKFDEHQKLSAKFTIEVFFLVYIIYSIFTFETYLSNILSISKILKLSFASNDTNLFTGSCYIPYCMYFVPSFTKCLKNNFVFTKFDYMFLLLFKTPLFPYDNKQINPKLHILGIGTDDIIIKYWLI